ncbi:MAG TPA: YlbF family regulator [Bacillota bacterium]|nr:YlbF family regulator [Bacillota bacterium]
MALYTREEVLDEAKKLAHMLSNIEEINRFKVIEAKINRNERLQSLIKKLKVLQKQAVNLEAYEKKKALEIVETEIKKIEDEIDEMPIVQEFKEVQDVVNDILQLVSGTIARSVTNNIIEETGGDLLTGKTGTKIKDK